MIAQFIQYLFKLILFNHFLFLLMIYQLSSIFIFKSFYSQFRQSLLSNFQILQKGHFSIHKQTTTLSMKSMQNYLMKPDQLRKKLQNPKFRSTFLQWSKSNPSLNKQQSAKYTRSKSPLENYQKSLNLHKKTTSAANKQNIRPNSLSNKNPSNVKLKVTSKQSPTQKNKQRPSYHQVKKRAVSESSNEQGQSNKNYQSNKSLDKNYISSLSSKNRYNSMSSIMNPPNEKRKERANSSVDQLSTSTRVKQNNNGFANNFELKYAYRTKQGVQITNPSKTNQDSLLIKTNLSTLEGSSMFAVADGHGMFGHLVSQYLVKNLSKQMETQIKRGKSILQSIPSSFNKLQQGLNNNPQINASCSGSTMVSVIIEKQEILCANVGDSRAILARQIDKKNWEMIYLSQDHKPTIQAEKKRILKSGGKIHAFRDEKGCPIGPQRVWLPNQNMQGLAMSRSFGDNVSKPIGVTHVPQIIRLKIDKRDRFILIASDGVWQFISNQEVLQLLVPFYRDNRLEQACDALMKLAYERWTVQDKNIVDDITLILIFFDHRKQSTCGKQIMHKGQS